MGVLLIHIITIIIIIMSSVTRIFSLVLFLDQRLPPLHRLQVSDCDAFPIMCDVPSIAVCCGGSVGCYSGMACTFVVC
jgi:hypothetical protein